ncbi:integrase core domain-containing protein [Bradyrhizobium sp. Pha-3]|uniref:integrase core domain-containing protein n=1 Tax=Bradyrhizobium sp. Pha-3 TaxID=208375 RepID=UPI0035D450CC
MCRITELYESVIKSPGNPECRSALGPTRPYAPRTNGKAECFIQTSLRERVFAHADGASVERYGDIGLWTVAYYLSRPHAGIGNLTPSQRANNLLGTDNLS